MNLTDFIKERLQERRILLMTHAIVGYPSLEANWRMLELMAEAGVDVVELQMPFSEPMADGPIFVRANQLALEQGMNLEEYFAFFKRASAAFPFRLVMMGYYNTVFRQGHEAFCQQLGQCGGAGFILPDLPFEEYGDLFAESRAHSLDPILLMTPTNTEERLEALGQKARGFVYTVARKGVTGSQTALGDDLYAFIERCRRVTSLPLALGFGLRSGEDVRRLQGVVDMGIIGSALLECWEKEGEQGYQAYLQQLVEGCN